jgi:UDP-N-acetylglucosamine 2-epimerase
LSIERGPVKIMTVVGARPQFVKAAAVSRAMSAALADITEILVHTGQHYDYAMSDIFFEELGLREPDFQLGVGSAAHGAQTGEMMIRLERVVSEVNPDLVLVYGDTNSTLAAALVASKIDVRLAHVEAGLRSYDRSMPEEVNRVVTDHLADQLFCPSRLAVEQLLTEGVSAGVALVGDVMLDVFRLIESHLPAHGPTAAHGIETGFLLLTLHRPVNTDDTAALARICRALEELAADGHDVIWPVHPRLRGRLPAFSSPRVVLTEPVGYVEMLTLLRDCAVVLTDSGGLQKEALWSGKPCVTMRTTTEWVETVDAGWNVLVGNDASLLVDAAANFRPTGNAPDIYGDGHAAPKIVDLLLRPEGSARALVHR